MSREGTVDEDSHFSPSRLKFPCSYGGKILPRPSDGQLKYIGGETRVISVPRSITFQELKEKISGMFNNSDIVIKYQVYPEDLDTLVSVRSDEDLQYMLEEYDRHESIPRSPSSSPRFRIFLFPSTKSKSSASSPTHPNSTKGSLNTPFSNSKPPAMFAIKPSSPCSSPPNSDFESNMKSSTGLGLQRVRSTPNLSQLNNNSKNSSIGSPTVGGGTSSNPLHYNQSQQPRNMMRYGGGNRGGMSRVGVSYRYETCVCGRVILGHQRRQRRYHSPQYAGPMCAYHYGHVDECHTPHSGVNGNLHFSGNSPGVRPRSIWE